MKVYVFVGMYMELFDEIKVFSDKKDAEKAWSEYTKMKYSDFEADDTILEYTQYEGTAIHEAELQ